MPPSLASLRTKLTNKLFNTIGTATLSLIRLSTTTDKWGDETTTLTSSTTVTGIPYDLIGTEEFQPFADLQVGDLALVVPYDTTFDSNDRYVYDGATYIIKETSDYHYQGETLAFNIRLSKVL